MATCKLEGFDKTKKFEDQYGWINKDTQDITINEPRILETLTHNIDPIARQIAAMTPLHEITHREINTKKIFIGTEEEVRNVNLAAQGLLAEVEMLTANGTIQKEIGDLVIKRMKKYAKEIKKGGTYDEFLTTYTELMALTGINTKQWTNLSGMRQVMSDIFKMVGKGEWATVVNPFNKTSLIKSFLANFLDRVKTYKKVIVGDEEKEEKKDVIEDTITQGLKEAQFSFSTALDNTLTQSDKVVLQQAGDQINQNITEQLALSLNKDISELTKADWQKQGLADAYMYLIAEEGEGRLMLDNLIRMGLRTGKKMRGPNGLVKYGKNITGNDVYGVPIAPLFLEDVGQQLYRRTIQRFNPAQNDDLGGFIVSELMDFRIGEVVNQYAKRYGEGREVSQEKILGQAEDLKLADTLISDEISPEEYTDQQLALERERKAVIVKQKGKTKVELPKRSIVRQDMSTIKAIEDKVKKEIQGKLTKIIEEVLISSKDITSIDQLIAAIEKKLGDEIIKKLGGTIGMKKGEFVVPEQWLDFVKNEYNKLVKGIPSKLIKKSYQDLYNITPTGDKVNITTPAGTHQIDRFAIDQPTKEDWINYFARPQTATGKPVSVKNKYIARQRGLAGIVVREMVKEQMKDYLADPKNVQTIAEKLNIPPGQIIATALRDQIINQFDYDINEQKDNLASLYSFSAALDNQIGGVSLSKAINGLSLSNRALFDSYVAPFIAQIEELYKTIAQQFPNQLDIELGLLDLEKAWNEIFPDPFLSPKQRNKILNSLKNLLNYFNPTYKDIDSGVELKQTISDFLYDEVLAQDEIGTLKSLLNLGKGSLDFSNQKQRTSLLNSMGDVIRDLLDKNKVDEALAVAFMVGNAFNQSGKAAKGGEKVAYDIKSDLFGYVPSDDKVGGLRYSIFKGNENFGKEFLQPLFEQYGIVIEVDVKGKKKDGSEIFTIKYVKDGILEDFSKIKDIIPQTVGPYIDNIINGDISTQNLKASENYAKDNIKFLIQIADHFKNKLKEIKKSKDFAKDGLSKEDIEEAREREIAALKNSWGMFLMSANGDMRAPVRASARVDSMVTNLPKAFIKAYTQAKTVKEKNEIAKKWLRYEHNPPARTTQIGLTEYILDNWNKSRLNDMFKTSGVSIITKAMDDQINLFFKDSIPTGIILGDSKNSNSKWNRYFDSKLWGAFNQEIIYYKKKGKGYERVEIGEGQIEAYKQKNKLIKNNTNLLPSKFQPSTALDNNSIAANTLDNYTKAQANALKYPVENKGISIFDFDDTIATSKSKVLVYAPYYPPGSAQEAIMELTPAEFAEKAQDLEAQGAAFDFSQFNKIIDGKKGPLFTKLQKAVNKFGNDNVFILTARPQIAAIPIKVFLDGLGVELKIENIVGLEDGTPGAKANWVAQKAAEGYNDFYFTDDAYNNVKAVQDVLDVVDVKGKTHQAQYQFSDAMDKTFNEMLERKTGISKEARYSRSKGEIVGKKKRDDIFITSDADDFEGLMYRTLGKGKQGDMDKKFLKKALYNPFGKAMSSLSKDRINLMEDFKQIKKELDINTRNLRNIKVPGGWNAEQAIRVYIWNKQGMEIPGLSKGDIKNMVDFVNKNINYQNFADKLIFLNKGDAYMQPKFGWLAGTIATDLEDNIRTIKRDRYLEDTGWKQNKDIIFSEKNLNKLEAAFGKTYRVALEDMLQRMETGRSRTYAGDSLTGNFIEWINGSIGAIMFFNTRSAILQTISAANFINWTDNNILTASKAFANQKQFWSDFGMLFNSEFLVDRRRGLRINLNEADLAEAAKLGGFKGAVSYMLKLGFLPTQIMDSFAIASGGASFYRNRLKTYLKKGLGPEEAHNKTMIDWREIAETSQQSARADKISQQQAGPLGRVILAFANTPMQYTRLMKKAALDLANGRGDWRTNVSKLVYYGAVQNFFFNAMQQAMFALGFGDADEDEKTEKYVNVANGMADSILRGTGFYGAAVAAVKNSMLKFYRESNKRRPKYENAIWELMKFSPPLGNKVSKLRSWARTLEWDAKEIKEKGFSMDNPALMAYAKLLSAATNIPLDRLLQKIENMGDAMHTEAEMWQRIALFSGWRAWELDFDPDLATSKMKSIYNLDLNLDLDLDLDNLNLNF